MAQAAGIAERDGAPATAGWGDLDAELLRWEEAGQAATLWWRDDDATGDTPALRRLLGIAGPVPVALAAVPASVQPGLIRCLAAFPAATVLQHGWSHADNAPPGTRAMELAPGRDANALAELAAGAARLRDLLGTRFLPVLVPPWNRIDPGLVPLLRAAGIAGLSTLGPRRARDAAPGLPQVNVHVDLVDWRGTRGFAGEGAALGRLVDHLAARRRGTADAAEPTGILTHHAVLDDAAARFLAALLARAAASPATRLLAAAEAFAP